MLLCVTTWMCQNIIYAYVNTDDTAWYRWFWTTNFSETVLFCVCFYSNITIDFLPIHLMPGAFDRSIMRFVRWPKWLTHFTFVAVSYRQFNVQHLSGNLLLRLKGKLYAHIHRSDFFWEIFGNNLVSSICQYRAILNYECRSQYGENWK